jgi:multidrug transporter EmrE-like cation transporter
LSILSYASPATLWALGAAFPAVLAEYLYRRLEGPWEQYWYVWTPIALSVSYCICQLVRTPNSSLLDAFVVWAFSTTAMRVCVSLLILGESIKGGTWFALGLLLMARIAQTFWGR